MSPRPSQWSLATLAVGDAADLTPGSVVEVTFRARGPGSPSPRVAMTVLRADAATGQVSLALLRLDRRVLLHLAESLRVEQPLPEERRITFRHRDPPLRIEIGGRACHTLNWSLTGLLIGGFAADEAGFTPSPDQLVEVRFLDATGSEVPWAYTTVVRFDPDLELLALRLTEFGRPVLEHLAGILNRHKP